MSIMNYNAENLSGLNKNALIEIILAAQEEFKARGSKSGRKDDVLRALKMGPASIQELADRVSEMIGQPFSTKNVSSQLTYLRKDGWDIHRDGQGRQYINAAPTSEPEVTEEVPAE